MQLLCNSNPYSYFCKPSFNFSTKASLLVLVRPGSVWHVIYEMLVVEENRNQWNWVILYLYQIATGILHQVNSGDGRVQWVQWQYTNTHILFWSDRRANVNPAAGGGPCRIVWANGVSLHLCSCSRVWIWVLQLNFKIVLLSPAH